MLYLHTVSAQEGPGTVIARPGQDVELLCNITGSGAPLWRINGILYSSNQLFTGQLGGHNVSLIDGNIIVENVMINDDRNGSVYICLRSSETIGAPNIESNPFTIIVAGEWYLHT